MRKTFNYDDGIVEEYEVDYMVLFGAYDNEHPENHYSNRKSKGKVYETIEEAREQAEGYSNAKIWEIAHCDDGGVAFVTQVK